jgi:hypothetical protein
MRRKRTCPLTITLVAALADLAATLPEAATGLAAPGARP